MHNYNLKKLSFSLCSLLFTVALQASSEQVVENIYVFDEEEVYLGKYDLSTNCKRNNSLTHPIYFFGLYSTIPYEYRITNGVSQEQEVVDGSLENINAGLDAYLRINNGWIMDNGYIGLTIKRDSLEDVYTEYINGYNSLLSPDHIYAKSDLELTNISFGLSFLDMDFNKNETFFLKYSFYYNQQELSYDTGYTLESESISSSIGFKSTFAATSNLFFGIELNGDMTLYSYQKAHIDSYSKKDSKVFSEYGYMIGLPIEYRFQSQSFEIGLEPFYGYKKYSINDDLSETHTLAPTIKSIKNTGVKIYFNVFMF